MSAEIYLSKLPTGIRSRHVDNGNGLSMHYLEAGGEDAARPVVLLLHGFPELAFSWRKVMPALAAAGFRVIAPDQRGYGLTTGWDGAYETDLRPYTAFNLVRDVLGFLSALAIEHVKAVFGHDFGSFAAANCALMRPDIFRALVMMSMPYAGPPSLKAAPKIDIDAELAVLERPRKHYQIYYSTPEANGDMWRAPQGVHDFLRAYFHHKSADWKANKPYPLKAWSGVELAKLPTYYVMDRSRTMAQTVAPEMPSADEIANCGWLPDDELRVYSAIYGATGFQGGLNWYRARFVDDFTREMQLYSGMRIQVPAIYVAGSSDWGIYQVPGAFEAMQRDACADFRGAHLLEGAGHWVQQEQAAETAAVLLRFLHVK